MNLRKGFITIALTGILVLCGVGMSTVFASNIDVTPESVNIQSNHASLDFKRGAFINGVGHFLGGLVHDLVRGYSDPYQGDILGSSKSKDIEMSVNFDVIFD